MVFVAVVLVLLDTCVATIAQAHGCVQVVAPVVLTLVTVVELFLRLVVPLLTPNPVLVPL